MSESEPIGEVGARREARERVARYITDSDFPGSAALVARSAEQRGAPDDVLALLRGLDPDQEFLSPLEVFMTLGYEPDSPRM